MLLISVKWLQRNWAHFDGCYKPIEEAESVNSIMMIGGLLKLETNVQSTESTSIGVDVILCEMQVG